MGHEKGDLVLVGPNDVEQVGDQNEEREQAYQNDGEVMQEEYEVGLCVLVSELNVVYRFYGALGVQV